MLWTAASYLVFWADIWCERTGAQQEEALRALAAGERDQALGVWPSIGYFWFALAERLVDRSQWEAAERAYERATQLDPDYPPAWERLGDLRRRFLKNYEAAETAYKEALKLDEHYAEARSGLGDALARLDDHEGAVRELIRATKDDSENAKVWNMLGFFYSDMAGKQDKADKAYRKAMELDSRVALTRQNYAEGGLLIRDFSRAEEYLNKAEPLLVNDTDRRHQGILQLALSLARSDREGAKAAHERLTAINERLKKPSTWWNFQPLRRFSEGLDRPSRALLDAWIDAVEHKLGENPATAFADYMKRVEPTSSAP